LRKWRSHAAGASAVAEGAARQHKAAKLEGSTMAKLSMSRAWEETKAIITRDGRLIAAVALALFVFPGLVLSVVVPEAPSGEFPRAGPWIAVALVAILVSLIGQLAVIRLAIGPHLTVGEAIMHGVRRLLSYLGAAILWTLPFILLGALLAAQIATNPERPPPAASLGFLVLMVAAAFFAVRFLVTSAVASAEPIGPIAILQRSWTITAGNWWRLFAFLLLFGIGALALLIAVESVTALIAKLFFGGIGPLTVGGLLVALISQLLSAFLSVALFVMLARIYVQLAGRGEAQAGVPSSGV
jgi:hypothetical protein